MSLITNVAAGRSWMFSDIQTGDVFWLSAQREHPKHCMARFRDLSPDGKSREFHCENGAWVGTLTEQDEGALELCVHRTGSKHFVYICEKLEAVPVVFDTEACAIPY